MRAPVLLDSWWKRTVLGEVALNSLTGTLTSPKLIAPDQIARAISVLYSAHGVSARYDRRLAGNLSPALPSDRCGCQLRRDLDRYGTTEEAARRNVHEGLKRPRMEYST